MKVLGTEYKIDHGNRDGLDNQKNNLRIASVSENQMNRRIQSNNKSGYRGVYFYHQNKKWHAQIQVGKKKIHVGYFKDIVDAVKAYNKAALKYHGEFASLNTIPE